MRPAPCPVHRLILWVVTEKHSVATPLLEFLSRHKVFYHERNVPPPPPPPPPPLIKLCRDIRRPLSLSKPGPAPNPIATLNSCRDTRPKNLCHNPNHPACLGTVSRHRDLYHDTDPESSIPRASQPHAHACRARLNRVVRLAWEPCQDMKDPVET